MYSKTIGNTCISPLSMGSVYSFELKGSSVVSRLFGVIPVHHVHLADVHYLRLATRDEVSIIYSLFNWAQFHPLRRARCPVYILQTNKRRCLFLKLKGDTHFKLRQAIARHQRTDHHIAA